MELPQPPIEINTTEDIPRSLYFKTKKGKLMKTTFYDVLIVNESDKWFIYHNPESRIAYILLTDKDDADSMSSSWSKENPGVHDPYDVYVNKGCTEISTEFFLGAESTINRCFHGVKKPCEGLYLEPAYLPGFVPDWDMCSHCGMGSGTCGYSEWHKVGKYRSSGVLALDRERACRSKIKGRGLFCEKHS